MFSRANKYILPSFVIGVIFGPVSLFLHGGYLLVALLVASVALAVPLYLLNKELERGDR